MTDRNALRNAIGLIPGGRAVSAGIAAQDASRRAQTTRPTANGRAAEAARVAALRRSRIEAQLQADAQRARRAPLSRNELDRMLREHGL